MSNNSHKTDLEKLNHKAVALYKSSDSEGALAAFSNILKLTDPNDAEFEMVKFNLVFALLWSGKTEDALLMDSKVGDSVEIDFQNLMLNSKTEEYEELFDELKQSYSDGTWDDFLDELRETYESDEIYQLLIPNALNGEVSACEVLAEYLRSQGLEVAASLANFRAAALGGSWALKIEAMET